MRVGLQSEESNGDLDIPEDFTYPIHPSPEPDPLANNPYLKREKCLLCQRDRTEDDESDSEGMPVYYFSVNVTAV